MSSERDLAAAAIAALVGPRTGIVRGLQIAEPIDGDATLHHVSAEVAQILPELARNFRNHAAGSGTTRAAAVLAAIGEAFERYTAGTYQIRQFLRRTERELPNIPRFSAAELAPFSAEQRDQPGFPFATVEADTPLEWVLANGLGQGMPVTVPAFALFSPYISPLDHQPIAPGLSTGLACAPDRDSAVESGLCEVIERDALARTWMLGLTPPCVRDADVRAIAGDLLPSRDDVRAYDLGAEFGPRTFLIVARGEGPSGPLLSVGSACRCDPRAALRKAVLETSQDRIYVRQLLKHEPDWRPTDDGANVTDFSYHARLYSVRPDWIAAAFAFLDGGPTVAIADESVTPQETIARLVAAGHRAAYFEFYAPNPLGWYVVKVLIPSLLPLHGDHRLRYLGHPRLSGSARSAPHPFP